MLPAGAAIEIELYLEVEPNLGRKGSWGYIMGATEGRNKIVERFLIQNVDGGQA